MRQNDGRLQYRNVWCVAPPLHPAGRYTCISIESWNHQTCPKFCHMLANHFPDISNNRTIAQYSLCMEESCAGPLGPPEGHWTSATVAELQQVCAVLGEGAL